MIMKKQLLFMTSVLMLLAACNSDDQTAGTEDQQAKIPILLQAGMSNMTRASGDLQNAQFAKNSVINVYIKEKLTGNDEIQSYDIYNHECVGSTVTAEQRLPLLPDQWTWRDHPGTLSTSCEQ